jgi:zinc protease
MPKLSFLNEWKGERTNINKNLNQENIVGKTIYLVHKPGPQSIILMGHHGLKYDVTGDYFKSQVMNYVLGGAFNSRLNLNLREDKGYTYGIRSGFNGNDTDGSFSISASVKGEATDSSLTQIFLELEGYLSKGITQEELNFTKNSIANSDALRYETPGQKARFLSRIQRYNLDQNYTTQQRDILQGFTTDDIHEIAKKNIDKENMIIVVVGNKYSLKEKLSKFGKVQEIKLK